MRSSLFSAAIICALGRQVLSVSGPLVVTGAGTLEGGRCNGTSDAVYFKSIPYAEPPIGKLRFASPKPYAGGYHCGIRQATSSPASCIQFGYPLFAESGPTSEDW
jgi:carboxylesterase type B